MRSPKPVLLTSEIRSSCDPDILRRLLADPSTWSEWQPEILYAKGPEPMAPGDTARGRARMLGFEVHGQSTALSVGARHFEEDAVVGVHMKIRYELEAVDDGIVVRHRLELERSGGPAGRILNWLLRRRLKKMQEQALRALVAVAGRGRA